MTEIMLPGHSNYTDNLRAMSSNIPLAAAGPKIEMLPNPDFSFPRIPPADSMPQLSRNSRAHRRPMSVHMDSLKPQPSETSHRRGASMLPSFTFNASDTTGLTADQAESTQTSPARSAHKRNTSELVGGHGVGMSGAISASPTKSAPLAVPGRPSGHKSRASRVTLSSSDWSAVMTTAETQPRLSSSLPNTPLDGPPGSTSASNDPFGPPLDSSPARPPSRPRVEFSENVEYIPRPLSTISSETESSMSTVRGHSVNNSISSVLSLSSPSPPSSRARTPSLSTTLENEPRSQTKSPIGLSRRVEREGQWLKHGNSHENLRRPISQPSAMPNKLTFATEAHVGKGRGVHGKHKSLSYALGFDRRRSEPAMGMHADEPSRFSTISLQDPVPHTAVDQSGHYNTEQRSSSRRLKDWAVSKISRRGKESGRRHFEYLAPSYQYPHADASPVIEPESAEAETDLDAVFSMDADPVSAHSQRVEIEPPVFASHTYSNLPESDDSGGMLDLDAALGPFKTPPFGAHKSRRELHSSRGARDFFGPGGHYQPTPSHRRAESAPMLTPWDQTRIGTPPQPGMADVFEEEEEEEGEPARPGSTSSTQDEESRMGVQIVDSDVSANSSTPSLSLDDGLRIRHAEWESERPATAFSHMSSSLGMPVLNRRASSVIEDTIIEESSPVEPAIVEFHEEPRAHSLTKSSDSSETPTIVGGQPGMLTLPDGQQSLTTPESYQTSAFSTPDFTRRQTSFDTSRVGTSASSMTGNRTMSSCTTGEPTPDVRISVDDIPSLTSSRSTMLSTSHANSSRRDISGLRTPSVASGTLDSTAHHDRWRKRASIASLSQLVGSPFGPRPGTGVSERPQTAATDLSSKEPKKKEHRLKKLMFWKSKHRQASTSTIS
ncbi:uncharacterized protein CLAFUR5_02226 [Fulvia fulva]|uniref:Cell wall proline rich protein n=1 Tax=Passalora fulva TaxID=5499 RepID=A0A9Q8L7V8_PASFU|nr:uncharacterized protein CLAFUR5_02226 [Fulvia fulva]KAK4637620.1 hypothetical protein CLAFUR0_02234 [Fulvia fulva]UJO12415.1 hypothetical protein CLAFUR5_02226 [Fulvia fulva]